MRIMTRFLKGAILFAGLIGALMYGAVIPTMLHSLANSFPEYAYLVGPYRVAITFSALPILASLAALWMICDNVGRGQAFSRSTAKYLMAIGICALIDTVYAMLGAGGLWLANVVNPGVLILSLCVVAFGLSVSAGVFVLIKLVEKAAGMEEELENTV